MGPKVSNLACSLLSSVEDEHVRNNREQRLLKENQIADDKLLVKLQEAKATEKKGVPLSANSSKSQLSEWINTDKDDANRTKVYGVTRDGE